MNNLLFFYVCCAFTLIQVNTETRVEKLSAIRTKCAAENGLTKDDISWENRKTFFDNPLTKCYLACVAENLHLFREGHSFDEELSLEYVRTEHQGLSRSILNKCVAAAAPFTDRCEKAYVAFKCTKEEDRDFYFSLVNFYRTDKQIKDDAQFEA